MACSLDNNSKEIVPKMFQKPDFSLFFPSVCCLEMTTKRKIIGRLVPCRCFRGEEEIVSVLDYSHCGLQQVPKEVFNFERTLEELYLDANQIEELPKVISVLPAIHVSKSCGSTCVQLQLRDRPCCGSSWLLTLELLLQFSKSFFLPDPMRRALAARGGEGAANEGLNWEINSCSKEIVLAQQVMNVALDTLARNALIYGVAGLPFGASVALWLKRALCQLFIPVGGTPVLSD